MLGIIFSLTVCYSEQINIYVSDYIMGAHDVDDRKFNLYHAGVIVESSDRKFLVELHAKYARDVFRVMFPVDSGDLQFLLTGQLHWDNPAELYIIDLMTEDLPAEYNNGTIQHAMKVEVPDGQDLIVEFIVSLTERWSNTDFDLFNVLSADFNVKFLSSHLCHDLVEWTLRFFAARGGVFQVPHIVRDELFVYGSSIRQANFSTWSDRFKLLQYLLFLAVNSDYADYSFGEARDLFIKPKLLGGHYPVGNLKALYWVDVAAGGLELCYVSYNSSFHRTARVCVLNASPNDITQEIRFIERLIFFDQIAWASLGIAISVVLVSLIFLTRSVIRK
jgi:hypothetical protein